MMPPPGYMVIRAEMMHVRIIPLDGAPDVDDKIRGWMGDSRGHWEGDTLVVETTNVDPKGWIPKWLVNMIQEDWPRNTILGWKKQAAKPDIKPVDWFEGWF